jgi:hypothetical protein
MKLIACLFSIFLLSACQKETASPTYFPLNDGWIWSYQQTITKGENTEIKTFKTTNTGTINISDHQYHKRTSTLGTEYLIDQNETAIRRVAKRTIVQDRFVFDLPAQTILPTTPSIGHSWSVMTPLFLMERNELHGQDQHTLLYSDPVLMNFTIEDMHINFDVKGKTYKDCIKLVGLAQKSLFVDTRKGFVDVPITQTEVYCKEIGMVFLERDEPLISEHFTGGAMRFELTTLTQP